MEQVESFNVGSAPKDYDLQRMRFFMETREVDFECQGRLVKLRMTSKDRSPADDLGEMDGCVDAEAGEGSAPDSKRGEVTHFSAQSRKRLYELCQRLNLDAAFKAGERPKFLTLTYGQSFPSPEGAKAHLRAMEQRISRRWPKASFIWRIEFQERGAPHFHLIVFGLPFIPHPVFRRWWEQVIGWNPKEEKAKHVFVNLKVIKSMKMLSGYVSKYASKPGAAPYLDNETYLHVGRWWGVHNRAFLPLAKLVRAKISMGQWFWMVRRMARKIYKNIKNYKEVCGFTLYMEQAKRFFDFAVMKGLTYG